MSAPTSHLSADLIDFERYLDEQIWSPTTIIFYRYIVSRLVAWMRSQDISTFSQLEIRSVKDFIARCGWGNSMARKLNSVMVQYFRHRFGADHQLTKWRVRREVAPPQRTLNGDQASKLLASFHPGISDGYSNRARRFVICDLHHPLGIRNFALLWTLLDTGFRSAEVCNLDLARLDLVNRTITGKVKFGKWRTALFSDRTAGAISDWLQVRNAFANKKSGDKIFIGVMNGFEGVPLTPAGLRSMLRKLGRAIGIGPLSPHDFRRTFATLAMRSGASIRAIQEAGGWSNEQMVMHYTRAIKGSEIVPHLPGNTLDMSQVYQTAVHDERK